MNNRKKNVFNYSQYLLNLKKIFLFDFLHVLHSKAFFLRVDEDDYWVLLNSDSRKIML